MDEVIIKLTKEQYEILCQELRSLYGYHWNDRTIHSDDCGSKILDVIENCQQEELIKITFGELSQRWGMSDKVCDILRLNPYCLNEGLATKEDTITVDREQALKLGIHENEFESRLK